MSENRKLTRRKRKLHHGPSSLLRATIQEYGIYDRQVDAFKAQFIDSFDFLENWQKNIKVNEKVTCHLIFVIRVLRLMYVFINDLTCMQIEIGEKGLISVDITLFCIID